MECRAALATQGESTILHSPLFLSMRPPATAHLNSIEPSRELATAASLMLSICKQDRFALLVVMHPAAPAIELLMEHRTAIASADSSSIQSLLMLL